MAGMMEYSKDEWFRITHNMAIVLGRVAKAFTCRREFIRGLKAEGVGVEPVRILSMESISLAYVNLKTGDRIMADRLGKMFSWSKLYGHAPTYADLAALLTAQADREKVRADLVKLREKVGHEHFSRFLYGAKLAGETMAYAVGHSLDHRVDAGGQVKLDPALLKAALKPYSVDFRKAFTAYLKDGKADGIEHGWLTLFKRVKKAATPVKPAIKP
jgi:hypothetical protein